jgi:predicted nucleic acid-binding protein
MKQKQKKLQKKEEKNLQRRLRLRKQRVKKIAAMKTPKRERKASMKKLEVVKVKAKRREEAKSIKKFKNTKFLLDTNTILDREIHKENILAMMKGTNNKILISGLVLAETRKREDTATKKSIMDNLKNLFGDRVEFAEITDEMKKKGEKLEKKHQGLGLHHPDCDILAQAIMINAVVITNDQALMDSCEAEGVDVNDQRIHVQKKPKKKKAKVIKPEKKYSGQDLDDLIH